MKSFAYQRIQDASEAAAAARAEGAQFIAGGTELLNWLRLGIAEPERLVDIGELPERGIALAGEALVIGALATLGEIGRDPTVVQHAGALAQACLAAASGQVRNRATLGGNVLQKTRCAYFRSEAPVPWPCNKRMPGSGCAALHGSNERHALFGWTDACVAVQPSDPLVALACLDAEAEVLGAHGLRSIPMTRFHRTQEEARAEANGVHEAQLETRLAPGELITRYLVPLAPGERSMYVKVRERQSYEYALVSAAAALSVHEGRIERARIALGSVAQRPWRLASAEERLVGLEPSRAAILPAILAALADARPLAHNGYKQSMAAEVAARAVVLAGTAS